MSEKSKEASKKKLVPFNIGPFRFTEERGYIFNCATVKNWPVCHLHPYTKCLSLLHPGMRFVFRLAEVLGEPAIVAHVIINYQPACVAGYIPVDWLWPVHVDFLNGAVYDTNLDPMTDISWEWKERVCGVLAVTYVGRIN